jgi:CheY-like chemotaxis protein
VTGDVLVVDDSPVNIRVVAEVLQGAGYRVRAATSGPRALDVVRAGLPELILLDVEMPEMDGWEVCARLKGDPATASIPVVFLSGHDDAQERARAFESGAADYVAKPAEPVEVLARVGLHIGAARLAREVERLREELRQARSCPHCGR